MANHKDFPSQCGITIIHDLGDLSPQRQAKEIEDAFYPHGHNDEKDVAMVLISDSLESTNWATTKKIATQGVVRVNPNTGSRITVWTILYSHIAQIRKSKAKR